MYFVNFNKIIHKKLDLRHVLSFISKKSDICIMDISEVERMWPLDENQSKVLYKLHDILADHKGEIFYLGVDCNIFKRYDEWKEFGFSKKFNVYTTPLNDIPKTKIIKDFIYDISIEDVRSFDSFLLNLKIKKNFMMLTSCPRLSRLLILDRFYQNNNFDYSFNAIHHDYKFKNEYIEIPYKWNDRKNSIETNRGRKRLDQPIYISKQYPMSNGFNYNDHFKELTEIVSSWKPKALTKDYFNYYLPKENFESVCDIVTETYCCNDSVFFTEKTWKEIIFKRPFILYGAEKQYSKMKNLGFESYDELFNYDFDVCTNPKDRLELVCLEIEKYLNLEPDDFFEKSKVLKEKIEFNFNHYVKLLKKYKNISDMIEYYYNFDECLIEDNNIKFKKSLTSLEEIKELL